MTIFIDRFEKCHVKTIKIEEKYRRLFLRFDENIEQITKVMYYNYILFDGKKIISTLDVKVLFSYVLLHK